MKFHILTLFPEMILQGLHTSIIGRAMEKQILEINAVNIRDFTTDKHGKVDDYTYGGGAGMLMQAQPVFDAWSSVVHQSQKEKIRTVYVTPQGIPFTQRLAKELAKEEELIFLCGHYEGIDERVLEEVVTDYVSIGDYVLTGGELPAMVMTDAIARLVPGVLNNEVSAETESFHNDLLEYPQYSRPEVWREKRVPQVLLSGNHDKITKWRLEQSEERTRSRRPDLYAKYQQKMKVLKRLSQNKRINIHMMENLSRGRGQLLYAEGDNLLIYDEDSEVYMLTAGDMAGAGRLLEKLPEEAELFVVVQDFVHDLLQAKRGLEGSCKCYQACYTKKEALPIQHKDIRPLGLEHMDYVTAHYGHDEKYIRRHILNRELFGCFWEGRLAGFVGIHTEGSFGMLYVDEAYRGLGIAASLEGYVINLQRAQGFTPYCNVIEGNEASLRLQEKLGLYIAKEWL
ncbi:MAG: tRNA (guanosine(37)-N1)-methyltransferase TrmD, partial [Lachnospiraceae bacterium]|nr:tRNA (guanosine(37)-N1)-methyltransferase TrmD [Lachnospiraceae bacterium]